MSIKKVSVSTSTSVFGVVLDHLFRRKNLRYISRINDFWVPFSEVRRYQKYDWIDGIPDQDTSKLAKVVDLVERRSCALDIGANIGTTATYLSRHFDTVHAFEPAPDLYEALRRNLEKYPQAVAHKCAVGGKLGSTNLTLYTKHGQTSHVESEKTIDAEHITVGPITVRTIDSLKIPQVDFIKIDVEGFESPVVEGALETIKHHKPLIMIEQAANDENTFGFRKDQASEILRSLGMVEHPNAPANMRKDRLFIFPT
ncbi:FkbM family methyltransferase [uncultured Roseibium sp.]|uniref:FkbM family methyltransferase n=1 Tax=uncultured Roseibium sp. TaxID=1936171 RepID=UPI0032164C3D